MLQTIFCALLLATFTDAHWRCGNLTRLNSGWPVFGDDSSNFCYQIVDDEMHWEEAHIHCTNLKGPDGRTHQGRLASFDTSSSLVAVRSWLSSIDWHRNGIWIGAKRCQTSANGFCWVDGSPINQFLISDFWGPGEPSRRTGIIFEANCVQLRQASNWRGYTMPCHTSKFHYSFVCQFPMLPSTTPAPSPTTKMPESAKLFMETSTTTTTSTSTSATTTTAPTTITTTSVIVDPSYALGVMMARGLSNPTSTEHSVKEAGVNLLLVGLCIGFGCALIIIFIVLMFVWRRCRPIPPVSNVQVVFTPVAPHGADSKSGKLSLDEELSHNHMVEMKMNAKSHPVMSLAALKALSDSPHPRSPPPAYKPMAAPFELNRRFPNESIATLGETSQDNIYSTQI